MQENRSFDHYFGMMRGVRGFGDPHPVIAAERQAGLVPGRRRHGRAAVPARRRHDLALTFIEDLDHSWDGTHQMFNGGNWDQWLPAKTTTCMAHMEREDLPFHYALADAFTVCDAYHCSMLGPTDPNRYYMWTGWDGNDGKGGGPVIANDELGYDWTTYPERLQQAGISWKIYQDSGVGLDAAGFWGWTSRPVHRQLRRQLAAVLPPVPERRAGQPALPARPAPEPSVRTTSTTATASSTSSRPTSRAASCRGVLDRRARGLHRAPGVARRLRRLVHRPGPRRADQRPRRVVQDGAADHLRRERRLLRPRRRRPTRTSAASPGSRRCRSTTNSSTAQAGTPGRLERGRRAVRPRRPRAAARRLAVEHGRLGLLGDVRPHVADPLPRGALRRARAQHHAVAARRLRRPDLGVRLRELERSRPDAARTSTPTSRRKHDSAELSPDAAGRGIGPDPGARRAAVAPARLPLRRRVRRRPRQAQPRAQEPRQARRPPAGAIADGPRRSLQLHDRRRRRARHRRFRTRAPTTSASTVPTASSATSPALRRRRCGSRCTATTTAGRLRLRIIDGSDRPRTAATAPVVVKVADAYGPDRQIRLDGTEELTIDTRHSGGWYDIALTTPSDPSFAYQLAGRLESGARLTERSAARPLVAPRSVSAPESPGRR